jgi:hypothetical protein
MDSCELRCNTWWRLFRAFTPVLQRLSRVCVVACGKRQVVVSCPNLGVELAFLSRKTTPALIDVITTSDDDDYDDDVSS